MSVVLALGDYESVVEELGVNTKVLHRAVQVDIDGDTLRVA